MARFLRCRRRMKLMCGLMRKKESNNDKIHVRIYRNHNNDTPLLS